MKKEYAITRIVNNNIVCSSDEDGRELILRGLGIGFQKKRGDLVPDEKVEKIFRISNHSSAGKIESILSSIPLEHVEACNAMIEYIRHMVPKKLSDNLYVTLTDHISFCIQRYQDGLRYQNPLLAETRRFYPIEYKAAGHCLAIVKKRFGINLSEDEAGFITLHIVNAELNTDMSEMFGLTTFIQQVDEIARQYYQEKWNRKTVAFDRLITHLKYLGQRILQPEKQEENRPDDPELQEMICSRYAGDYACVEQVAQFIEMQYKYEIEKQEKMYLTMHFRHVTISAQDN